MCGTAVDDAARETLRGPRPGSTLRKIPTSILGEYRDERRWYAPDVPGGEAAPVMEPNAAILGEAITV